MPKEENVNHKGHRDRVRTLVQENGLNTLLPHQILEYLLFHAIPFKDTKSIAYDLLHQFGTFDNVFTAEYEELIRVKGMTRNAALFMSSFKDLFTLYNKSINEPKKNMSPANLIPYLMSMLSNKTEENLYLICMDMKNQLLHTDMVTYGDSVSLQIAVKDIVETALRHNAKKVVLAHNHPSENVLPSEADIKSTNTLGTVLSTIDVRLLDHIIVGRDSVYSLYLKSKLYLSKDFPSLKDRAEKYPFVQLNEWGEIARSFGFEYSCSRMQRF